MYIFYTAILGSLKNYVKYKKFNILLFLRTPICIFFIQLLLQTNNIWKILIYERWFMFIFKTFRSLYRNDYYVKREKYISKYNMKY